MLKAIGHLCKQKDDKMAGNVIKEYVDHVHDYEISSYTVDITNHILQIFAEYCENKSAITFTGLLAHHFDHVTYSNILDDVTEVTVDWFIAFFREMLTDALRFAFPVWDAKNCEDLSAYLKEKDERTFIIYSSLGLNGFVIAKEISVTSNP